MIRVLIADDHNLFREGLLSLLNSDKDITVVGQAEDGNALIAKYNELKPDVIVSDISMPVKSGPDAVRTIINKDKNAKAIFLSQYTGDDYIFAVLQVGALGLISKNAIKNELVLAISLAAKGKKCFFGKTDEELETIIKRYNLITNRAKGSVYNLTEKEKEILMLISENYSSQDIADKLKISIRTVETHRSRIIRNLGLKSLSGLISYALKFAKQTKEQFGD